ncbi:MAG TPA: serine/threonine-protein kinase, partial [Thermoanaerobaculia bacterium]|nr:serine/threonine-protein kinase [Thermoanaerobaculia bacterium]
MIGATLAHFRITAKLGEGGMGEVWRAEDSRLGRQVAIKVLPERFVADPDRLARFEREARVLASLSHPNIAGIYEVGEATVRVAAPGAGAEAGPYDDRGSSSGRRGGAPPPPAGGEAMSALPATPLRGEGRGEGSSATPAPTVHFLVMELAEGETLAERLARGPIPLAEALPIALQVAEAMEAAHERGIVHRDLKPGNVMVDARDRVKVLDFGLARALEPEPGAAAASGLTHSPTMTYQATMAGVLLGTAAYMSPEQAAGKPADRRADIWAFGVVVLEMLTGRRLFEGETVSHVLAGVLKDEPDWSRLAPQLPAPLRRLLARCLRKDPQRRLQSIGDARVALEDVRAGAASGVEETAITAAAVPQGAARWLPWVVAGAVALAAALVLVRGLAA